MPKGGRRPGAGRKKGAATLEAEALRALIARKVSEVAPEIVAALIEKSKEGDIAAIRELFDRGYGRPLQQTDITSKGDKIIPDAINDEQAVRIARRLSAGYGQAPGQESPNRLRDRHQSAVRSELAPRDH